MSLFNYLGGFAVARRMPVQYERDPASENALRLQIIKSIAELEKTKTDMKTSVLSAQTDRLKAAASGYADALKAATDIVGSQASTAAAKANFLENLTRDHARVTGTIAAGAADPKFTEKAAPEILIMRNGAVSAVASPLSEMYKAAAPLVAQLQGPAPTPGDMGGDDARAQALKDLGDMYIAQAITNPTTGILPKSLELLSGSDKTMVGANAAHMASEGASAWAEAVNQLELSPEDKQVIYGRGAAKILTGIYTQTELKAPGVLDSRAATQADALADMNARTAKGLRDLSVGQSKAGKEAERRLYAALEQMTGGEDPFAAMQVAKQRLGEFPPLPAGATPEQAAAHAKAYETALEGSLRSVNSTERFAYRFDTMPVGADITALQKKLYTQLEEVGKVRVDPMTAATRELRASVGDEKWAQWRKQSGSGSDEEAARRAVRRSEAFGRLRDAGPEGMRTRETTGPQPTSRERDGSTPTTAPADDTASAPPPVKQPAPKAAAEQAPVEDDAPATVSKVRDTPRISPAASSEELAALAMGTDVTGSRPSTFGSGETMAARLARLARESGQLG